MHKRFAVSLLATSLWGALAAPAFTSPPVSYLKLSEPQLLSLPPQDWEGDQQPHTLSVLEMNRGGFQYWGWYGLNNGRGIGLVRSNDLIHWAKFEHNPLWLNARWPSALKGADPKHPDRLYFAVTRDYDTPSSRIVLAWSDDGVHLTEIKNLVAPVTQERNQNPNLYLDPMTKRFFLTFYRGNDENYFDIVSKNADSLLQLDSAKEKLLMHSTETVAAPTLMYLPAGGPRRKGIYFLATEVYPQRYNEAKKGDWQIKVFYSDRADGNFEPVDNNPVETGECACLFQHEFAGNFYGYQCRFDHETNKWQMELVLAPLLQ